MMPTLHYREQQHECRDGETVLEALMRQGVAIPFSCRAGICHVCLQRCLAGRIPPDAQRGLRPGLIAKGYFLPCRCRPQGDLAFAPPRPEDLYTSAIVHSKELLAPNVCRLLLEPATALAYRPGHFINVRRADGLTRSYSLASLPTEDYFLELHVARMPGGAMSNWIFDELDVGTALDVSQPDGAACYVVEDRSAPLLLIAGGTGLSPAIGILRDALSHGHTGAIHLYHGVRDASELYLRDWLLDVTQRRANVRYVPCVSRGNVGGDVRRGRPHAVAFASHRNLERWHVHLAGPQQMVLAATDLAQRAGALPGRIHADPFCYTDLRRRADEHADDMGARTNAATRANDRRKPRPDPEMWAALRDGELLSEILADFYEQVFEDPRLAPYFRGITRQRLVEKVYSFMRHLFTGEKIYFGDWPRNAHHWMVIPDDVFDHREALMESCLRRHGLPEHLIRRWRALENSFRADIVKALPFARVMAGVELPLDGYGEQVVTIGTLCDSCGLEVQAGEHVRYHLRLGSIYCRACMLPLPDGEGGVRL